MNRLASAALALIAFGALDALPSYAVPSVPVAPHTTAASSSGGRAAAAEGPAPNLTPNTPDVDARAFTLVDFATGQVLAQRNEQQRLPPASLTKLMTCYVVFHALK